MNKPFLSAGFLALIFIVVLTGCGGDDPPAPAPIALEPAPTLVATAAPPTATLPATFEPLPSPTITVAPAVENSSPPPPPAPVPTATPSAPSPTLESGPPVSYTISIDSPAAGQRLPVARDFTFSGTVDPVPPEPLMLFLAAAGDELGSLLTYVEPDPATGSWSITTAVHPRRTGPATLRVATSGSAATADVRLTYADDEAGTFVTVNHPSAAGTVVAGRALIIDGESRNPIDNRVQIALYGCPVEDKTNVLAEIEIEVGSGPWNAYVIPPEFATNGCAQVRLVVTTGRLDPADERINWAADLTLELVEPTSEEARFITVSSPARLAFRPEQPTSLSGSAPSAGDSEIFLRLARNGETGGQPLILAETTATADRFGYWTAELTLPAGVEPGPAVLVANTGSGEEAIEFSQPVLIGE